jgi:fatty-acyl-CoA synthase
VRRTPDKIAIVAGEQRIDWRMLERRIAHTGGWLAQRGKGPGDIVAVLMKNSPAFLELGFATRHIGAVFLPINYRLAAASGAPDLVLADAAARTDSTRLGPDAAPADIQPRQPDDLFRLMCASGTTARPKGVIHTYANFHWKSADHTVLFGLGPRTRQLVVGPLYHVGAFDLPGVAVLWLSGTIVLQRDFDASAVLDAIKAERIEGVWLAPVMTGSVLAVAALRPGDVASLRWMIGGGDRTPESRIRAVTAASPAARHIDAHGMTETCSGDTFMDPGYEIAKIGSAVRPVAALEVRICDESGAPLPAGDTGEICLRGPKVTAGYWRDPERTAAAFFGDWLCSGDVGHLDADGFLFLTDRNKHMILSGGDNAASSQVERVLYELPEIVEAAVIGVPDERWGERPLAVVVMAQGAACAPEAILAHCRAKLAGFKVPKEVVQRERLPRKPSGKILKRTLREELAGYRRRASPHGTAPR